MKKIKVGDIARIKTEYNDMNEGSNTTTLGIVTTVTRSCDHEYQGIRKLEEHTGHKIDIIKVMTSSGITEWFDDELEIVDLKDS